MQHYLDNSSLDGATRAFLMRIECACERQRALLLLSLCEADYVVSLRQELEEPKKKKKRSQ